MADERLFYLNAEQTHDLAFDKHQWMVRRVRISKKGEEVTQPLWYVGSAKRHLLKGIGREGVKLSPEALTALKQLPETFGEFLFDRAQGAET